MPPKSPQIRVFDCHIARDTSEGFEFLLLKRAEGKIYSGDWRMVGGKIQDGEKAWEACQREIQEETQLPVKRLLVVPYINSFYEWEEDRINDIPVFVAETEPSAEPVLNDEHTEFIWIKPEPAREKLNWPGQREGLTAANALLKLGHPLQPYLKVMASKG